MAIFRGGHDFSFKVLGGAIENFSRCERRYKEGPLKKIP